MNARPAIADSEVVWFLEEEGLLPKRPPAARWPRLVAVPPGHLTESPEILPGDGGPIIPVPAHWYPGVPLPATYEPEEIQGYVEQASEPAAPSQPDYLAERLKQAAVPAGRYPIAILPRGIAAFTTRQTSGVTFAVTVTEGPWQGGEIPLRLVLDGQPGRLDGVIRHNLHLLGGWAKALGVGPATDPFDLIAKLGRAGKKRRVILDLREKRWADRCELYAQSVEVS